MAPPAIILDLDGTVWDSQLWYARLAGRGDADRVREALEDLRSGRPAARVLQAAGYTPASYRSACATTVPALEGFPGVVEALGNLKAAGVKLGAATNLPSWMANPMATVVQIAPLLDVLIDYGATKRHKPHPAPLLEALRRMGVEQSAGAWYVGDTRQDSAAAAAGGLAFAWAKWGSSEPEAPRETAKTLHQPADLLQLIQVIVPQG
jgi:phosphoglycolate phosphatase-like HAD superfamily hydrolase